MEVEVEVSRVKGNEEGRGKKGLSGRKKRNVKRREEEEKEE
jgi:hypothetical protein